MKIISSLTLGLALVLSTAAVAREGDALEWFPASDAQVQNSHCRSPELSIREVEADIKHRTASETLFKAQVRGFQLRFESDAALSAFRKLTLTMPDRTSACSQVLCAVKEIWGAELGPRLLHMLLKHGYNGSEFHLTKTRRHTLEEMQDIGMALRDLPAPLHMLGRNGNQPLVHITEADKEVPDAAANAGIFLFPIWSKAERIKRVYYTFHELAHNISNLLGNFDTSATWKSMSGWTGVYGSWKAHATACFVSTYGSRTPYEDFAESVAAYRYNPQLLQRKCPQKYAVLKEQVFRGREYHKSEACSL